MNSLGVLLYTHGELHQLSSSGSQNTDSSSANDHASYSANLASSSSAHSSHAHNTYTSNSSVCSLQILKFIYHPVKFFNTSTL